jgi:hypothetical protein
MVGMTSIPKKGWADGVFVSSGAEKAAPESARNASIVPLTMSFLTDMVVVL